MAALRQVGLAVGRLAWGPELRRAGTAQIQFVRPLRRAAGQAGPADAPPQGRGLRAQSGCAGRRGQCRSPSSEASTVPVQALGSVVCMAAGSLLGRPGLALLPLPRCKALQACQLWRRRASGGVRGPCVWCITAYPQLGRPSVKPLRGALAGPAGLLTHAGSAWEAVCGDGQPSCQAEAWPPALRGSGEPSANTLGFRGAKVGGCVPAHARRPAQRGRRSPHTPGPQNLAAWGVAGILAWQLFVVPERRAVQEQQVGRLCMAALCARPRRLHAPSRVCLQAARERARQHTADKGLQEVDRVRPTPDPQETGLMRGHRPPRE